MLRARHRATTRVSSPQVCLPQGSSRGPTLLWSGSLSVSILLYPSFSFGSSRSTGAVFAHDSRTTTHTYTDRRVKTDRQTHKLEWADEKSPGTGPNSAEYIPYPVHTYLYTCIRNRFPTRLLYTGRARGAHTRAAVAVAACGLAALPRVSCPTSSRESLPRPPRDAHHESRAYSRTSRPSIRSRYFFHLRITNNPK